MKIKRVQLLRLLHLINPDKSKDELFAMILCGDVNVDGTTVRDPKALVRDDAVIETIGGESMISRGETKLALPLGKWNLPLSGSVFIDAGSSSGGFTRCLLSRGVMFVHAVDVGYNQLDYRLRTDPRVRVHERTNIMECDRGDFEPVADNAVCDLSFRSIRGAARHILGLVQTDGFLVALVKPQFEWENPDPDFRGIVPDSKILTIVDALIIDLRAEGLSVLDAVFSPIRGAKGNLELFLLIKHGRQSEEADVISILENERASGRCP